VVRLATHLQLLALQPAVAAMNYLSLFSGIGRSYTDAGEHYDGQIGAEATPAAYIDSLIDCTREWMRVLKPSGSMWINLGDKYASGRRAVGTSRRGTAGGKRHDGRQSVTARTRAPARRRSP
jgi:DNA modification methylase